MDQDATNHLLPGSTLFNGKYTIVRMIGAGGFGCTYEAKSGDKRYCVKEFFMKQNCTRDPKTGTVRIINTDQTGVVNHSKKKFIEEATVLRMMNHPGIVHVVDIFEEHGTAYFAMDYIEGRSLESIVASDGPISEEQAISYMKQVANALEFVHHHNRLHLDIKPDNIMIDDYGRAILIDFGASKYIDQGANSDPSTNVFQTPGYAPPEQASAYVKHFGPHTDIYGLGATFYKVLSGITPYDVTVRLEGAELESMPDSISERTKQAVLKALCLNRKQRQQSAREFINMIADPIADPDGEVLVEADDDVPEVTTVDVIEEVDAGPSVPASYIRNRERGGDKPVKKPLNTAILAIAILLCIVLAILILLAATR